MSPAEPADEQLSRIKKNPRIKAENFGLESVWDVHAIKSLRYWVREGKE